MAERLGDYLRTRREALTPEAAGLVRGGARRTPGLRREEVATLADVSADYYERLERSRAGNPSAALLAKLAEALRLSADETDHLYHLAGQPVPARPARDDAGVEDGLLFVLNSLDAVPAHVLDGLTNVVAQNALSVALFGRCADLPGYRGNMTWRWFTDPRTRACSVPAEHEEIGRGWAAELRGAVAARGHDDAASRLVAALLAASEEFARYWATNDVYRFRTTRKTFVHPVTGTLRVNCDMQLSSDGGHRLMVLRPEPGTDGAERLARLRDAHPAIR
ncbi:helix-turn-helix transcriptional regulator [Catenuloplanes atrovinosus]|uniref:Transcriptional regulator with XRE-family HTH domain n=1 Tax=Catenuloplanes atrovinosus TaxID=137266 RepID=A0AAE3YNK1_9ACTN|nr:helix-turn-helix transcriptional regulator [Catenuloplanes atrovinosus]MDR7275031.1 transcriptional regulator with XRE-family HTH domain [Catenuloplanes atrovinosus]